MQNLIETGECVVNIVNTAFRVDWMPFAGRKKSVYNMGYRLYHARYVAG
ncbi:hypothetical protein [Colwellia sp. PAMC 20917]